jgi:hypothetical protein
MARYVTEEEAAECRRESSGGTRRKEGEGVVEGY